MPLRRALGAAALTIAVAIGGCGDGSYVRTSLGKEHHVEPAVNRISEKGGKARGAAASVQRDLGKMPGLLAAGDFTTVRQLAASILKRQPDSLAAHTYLAVALAHDGDAAGAGKHYQRATELGPAHPGALANYGIWLCEQGRAPSARLALPLPQLTGNKPSADGTRNRSTASRYRAYEHLSASGSYARRCPRAYSPLRRACDTYP